MKLTNSLAIAAVVLWFGTLLAKPQGAPPPPPPPFGHTVSKINVSGIYGADAALPGHLGLRVGMVIDEDAFDTAKARLKKIDPGLKLVMSMDGPNVVLSIGPPAIKRYPEK